ncbi:hypothetical protein J6590_022773 [Homalodisca vitripennis]|nr:hypothetical protein J6590_022773 [Homalodisca vitripennis]
MIEPRDDVIARASAAPSVLPRADVNKRKTSLEIVCYQAAIRLLSVPAADNIQVNRLSRHSTQTEH